MKFLLHQEALLRYSLFNLTHSPVGHCQVKLLIMKEIVPLCTFQSRVRHTALVMHSTIFVRLASYT